MLMSRLPYCYLAGQNAQWNFCTFWIKILRFIPNIMANVIDTAPSTALLALYQKLKALFINAFMYVCVCGLFQRIFAYFSVFQIILMSIALKLFLVAIYILLHVIYTRLRIRSTESFSFSKIIQCDSNISINYSLKNYKAIILLLRGSIIDMYNGGCVHAGIIGYFRCVVIISCHFSCNILVVDCI